MNPENSSNLMEQIARLSPEKRAMLELKLQERLQRGNNIDRVVRGETRETAPLTFAQQRFWFLEQFEPELALYNEWAAVRLSGPLNITALKQSIQALVRRHEALRTTIAVRHEQPVQVIAPDMIVPVQEITLRGTAEAERWDEAMRQAAEEIQRPFDLTHGPLFRVRLFHLDERDHLLLLTFHHSIIDAWSATILYRELGVLYRAFSQKQPPLLPELPVQYADFATWQQQWLQSAAYEAQLAYWKNQLADLSPLQLPTDRPRPPKQTYRGARQSIRFSAPLLESLNSLSRQEGVSLFVTLLAAFQTLLHRYTGQDDIVVGSPIAGRGRSEIEGLIGCFINTLALRSDFSGNPTFRALLGRVRSTVLDALAHQELPFEKLVETLQPERDPSRNPLFQVMLVLNNTKLNLNQFGELEASPVAFESPTAKFDLTLAVTEFETGLKAHLEYNTDLFDPATIERMVGHLETLLAGIVADSDQHISDLPILTEIERQQMLVEWNATQTDYPKDMCIHQWFEQQVERTPSAVAVVFEDQHLTYQELNARANQVAHHLQSLGVGQEALVGICVERSLELLVGVLGILKAGGAYVPLDPSYPPERLAFILQDAAISVLMTQASLQESLPPTTAQVVCLDSHWPQIAKQNRDNLVAQIQPDNLAYVIYTSGSTGTPKGVMVQHDNVVRLFTATEQWFHFNASDVWTLFHSYAFDFSVWEIWGALLYGGRLVIIPYWVSRSPTTFYQLLCEQGVTVLNQTPSAFRQLIWAEETLGVQDGLALRYVIFGGEALEPTSLQPWFERHGDTSPQLINMYGITETTVHVTYRPVTQADSVQPASLIGGAIPDLHLYILNPHQQLVPIGIPGELYVGGAGVSRGYLHRPQLTEERFVKMGHLPFTIYDELNPHEGQVSNIRNEKLLYRTGDLVRRLPNGDIEYLGRIDNQVKIRGFRIELGEIEMALSRHPAVKEAVVVMREDTSGDRGLVAYVALADAPEDAPAALRAHLRQTLPDYMIPSVFVRLDTLPLTPNGKVNRRALPNPAIVQQPAAVDFTPPGTPAEEAVTAIWREVLRLEQIDINDDFFDLGGHSLLATQVISRCRERFQVEMPLRDLFEAPTIAGLAGLVEQIKLSQTLQQTVDPAAETREEITL